MKDKETRIAEIKACYLKEFPEATEGEADVEALVCYLVEQSLLAAPIIVDKDNNALENPDGSFKRETFSYAGNLTADDIPSPEDT